MRDDGLYVGVMSGTSVDGVDAVLVDFSRGAPLTRSFVSVPFEHDMRERILDLCAPGRDSLDLAGSVSVDLAQVYATAVERALSSAGVRPDEIRAIGCHGQTVRHRPERGFTIQLNDAARLAELTRIEVVADFRSRDVAAGGQGAPLVPAFHEAIFRKHGVARAIVNIGGMANVTWLPGTGQILGFDCGPGNVLMDAWTLRHEAASFDEDGRWASTGSVDASLLEELLTEPFLALAPPKSTGRELFGMAWLEGFVTAKHGPADVQATLAAFTAVSIVRAIDRFCPSTDEIFLAGGGARNAHLVARIRGAAAPRCVEATDALGVPSGWVEPLAFAWLAMKCVKREPVDMRSVTGAVAPRVLGAIYPA
ncbi:MAG: anhydro-N-acetylmuramic acid kinase [Usitatibacter sp.]